MKSDCHFQKKYKFIHPNLSLGISESRWYIVNWSSLLLKHQREGVINMITSIGRMKFKILKQGTEYKDIDSKLVAQG